METPVIIAYIILLVYGLIIMRLVFSSKDKKRKKTTPEDVTVSIIIAFRNEEKKLAALLGSLENLNYNDELLEIILVNDYSEDNSIKVIQNFLNKKNKFNYTLSNLENKEGKKAAIHHAVKLSNNELIIQTDSDCIIKTDWVKSIADIYKQEQPNLILGKVELVPEPGIFNFLQRLEQEILMALTFFSTNYNRAIMANGANLAFPREFYRKAEELRHDEYLSSGDDVFLLFAAKKIDKKKIVFNESDSGAVTTSAPNNLISFMKQRIRWARKSKYIKDRDTLIFGSITFFLNVIAITLPVLYFLNLVDFRQLCFFFGLKFTVDTTLILKYSKLFRPMSIIAGSLLLSLLYPFYSIGIALLSLLYQPEWKGRKIKKA